MNEKQIKQELAVTEDLRPILAVLKEEDAQKIIMLKEELADNWNKKQIFRTETEMRVSVLNDGKHPTSASKYWQSVREMSAHFDAMVNLSFEMRRNQVKRLKLEQKMNKAVNKGNKLLQIEIQIDLDENLYGKACMEQVVHDRVREIQTWSKIKNELNDGSFDDKDVDSHQASSFKHILENRVASLNTSSSPSEIVNAVGPLQTLNRLTSPDGKLEGFQERKPKIN